MVTLEMSFIIKCHTNLRLHRVVQASWVSTTRPARSQPFRRWTAFRSVWSGSKSSWKDQRTPIDRTNTAANGQ